MARSTEQKSNSLQQLGYTVSPIHGKDEKGNEWVFKVKGTAPEFFIKKTKRGRLVAFTSKEAKIETTIQGLYNFKEENGDLTGQRAPSQSKSPQLVSKSA